ncbi:hypothetical protein KGY79_10035 [Candidatus Bipolaricaulota bacterium]|nr:hypothetical protein [Candidatus Bipolaricaulota bacterium]
MKYPVWSKSAFLTFILSALLVTSLLTSPIMADEHKVTVPINQVVKTEKLSAEQLAKSEVTVPISWVSESYLEQRGYLKEEQDEYQRSSDEGWTLVWNANFESGNLDGFRQATIDRSEWFYNNGCLGEIKTTKKDAKVHVVKDNTAPEGEHVLELVSNSRKRPGLSANVITANSINFEPGMWKVTGYFRKASSETGDLSVNLIRIDDFTENGSIFNWKCNKWDDYKLYVYRAEEKDKDLDTNEQKEWVEIDTIKGSDNWHYFEITTYLPRRLEKGGIFKKIRIDNETYDLNFTLPDNEKSWEESFDLYLETNNLWTKCDRENNFTSKARWDNLKVYKKPLKKNNHGT